MLPQIAGHEVVKIGRKSNVMGDWRAFKEMDLPDDSRGKRPT